MRTMRQPKRKRKDYTPFPGFYDLRVFNLNDREFQAAWRAQEYLSQVSKQHAYYKRYNPFMWEQIKELSAQLQMFLLPRLKRGKELQ